MKLVIAEEMQKMDKETIKSYGIPGVVLMEIAGLGATLFLLDEIKDIKNRKVSVVAGRGNNGGDGFVIARYLINRGVEVKVFLLSEKDKVQGDAKFNLDLLSPLKISVTEILSTDDLNKNKGSILHSDIIVDAIFGTGLNADVRGHFKDVINFINSLEKKVLAVDIPSGLNADTGKICGVCVRADFTATFGLAKTGHFIYPGKELTGKLKIIEIGIPNFIIDKVNPGNRLIKEKRIKIILKQRDKESHKGTTGHTLVIGGSNGKSGAVIMTSKAAARSGAGLVTTAVPKSLSQSVDTSFIDGMTYGLPEMDDRSIAATSKKEIEELSRGKNCIAIGPGIGTSKDIRKVVEDVIKSSEIPVVMDADGINAISDNLSVLKVAKAPIILTPHPGEMAKLLKISSKEVQSDRLKHANKFAKKHNVYMVLKGAATVIATPYGRTLINSTGNEGMATGGMGDVLTGMIAGFITQGYEITDSIVTGVFLHGLAADSIYSDENKPFGYLATDLIEKIPGVIGKILNEKS
ncbi:MAG: NAD(P)H-hydrate dehydratase [Deltaproteobacteria bacterium]|nr:NAD(P)H-hydrate dehydratase [Deltaproteobacteria bacterium]